MKLTDIELVTEKQTAFCKKLGLDVIGDSIGVAYAKISETIQEQFWGQDDLNIPTEKQIELSAKFKIDISKMSRLHGSAIIDDIMYQLNVNAIKEQKLKPGLHVRKAYEEDGCEYIISSINTDGTVYFKGGNGQKAWARNLVNVEKFR